MPIDGKALNRGLRATLWPALRSHGFTDRTERVAWRYAGEDIDVVELQAVGQNAAGSVIASERTKRAVGRWHRVDSGRGAR